jgi:outer membrane immunogenic protein
MNKLLVSSIAAFGLIGAPAFAADMAVKAPPPAVAPAPIYSWTGFYVGAGVGYGMFNVDNEGFTPAGHVDSTNQTAGGKGWFGTVVGGYDYQFSDRVVAGVFADADFSDIKGRLADTDEEGTAPLKQQWAWGVGGRIGLLVDPTVLTYINGGFTQAHFTGGSFANFDGASTAFSLGSQTFDGWFLGGGIEAMLFPGWFIKTEYRFADYETRDIPFSGNDVNHERSHPFVQTVRAELIYRFNWGSGPSASASTANVGMKPVYKAPPTTVVPGTVPNWTGFYIGGGFGYGMFNLSNFAFPPDVSTGQIAGGRGWFGTVLGGFDYQFNNRIVGGLFADADFSRIKGRLADTDEEETFPVKQQRAWAVGGRLGYLIVPSVLPYLNGGFTQAHFSGGLSTQNSGAPGFDMLASQTYVGWFLGGGVEMMLFPGWFVKTEYRLADYGTKDVFVSFTPSGGFDERIHPYVQTIRTTLTYRFNWGTPGAIVAKY